MKLLTKLAAVILFASLTPAQQGQGWHPRLTPSPFGKQINVVVCNAVTREGIEGASVNLLWVNTEPQVTDKYGQCEFLIDPGLYTITAFTSPPGYHFAYETKIALEAAAFELPVMPIDQYETGLINPHDPPPVQLSGYVHGVFSVNPFFMDITEQPGSIPYAHSIGVSIPDSWAHNYGDNLGLEFFTTVRDAGGNIVNPPYLPKPIKFRVNFWAAPHLALTHQWLAGKDAEFGVFRFNYATLEWDLETMATVNVAEGWIEWETFHLSAFIIDKMDMMRHRYMNNKIGISHPSRELPPPPPASSPPDPSDIETKENYECEVRGHGSIWCGAAQFTGGFETGTEKGVTVGGDFESKMESTFGAKTSGLFAKAVGSASASVNVGVKIGVHGEITTTNSHRVWGEVKNGDRLGSPCLCGQGALEEVFKKVNFFHGVTSLGWMKISHANQTKWAGYLNDQCPDPQCENIEGVQEEPGLCALSSS